MLPGLLSGDLCSLWSGRDRYAVSVLWEIDIDSFDIVSIWYGRTVIRSSYKLTYEVAQQIYDLITKEEMLSGDCKIEDLIRRFGGLETIKKDIPELKDLSLAECTAALEKLSKSISLLVDIASNIRTRRLAKGGLELESVEVRVQFADPETRTGKLEDLIPKEPLAMHNTVAELMIFTNHWVARQCVESYPDRSILRRHPPPRPEFFDELKRCVASRGFVLDTESNLSLANSLENAADPNDPEVNKVIRQLVTRAMTNALYFSTGSSNMTRDQFSHYGLALNLYTHFTSPIRRYADIIVHRLLLASLGDLRSLSPKHNEIVSETAAVITVSKNEAELFSPEELSSICSHMNEQHWAAQQVQRSSLELFQALFFKDKPVDDSSRYADGIICQLRGTNGFVAFVPRYGIRGAICIEDANGHIAWADYDTSDAGTICWLDAVQDIETKRVYSSEQSDCGFLEVRDTKTNERQQYHIFDHISVKIHISESVAHGLNLRLELIGRPKPSFKPKDEAAKAHTTTTNSSTCIPSVNANLIEDVQNKDAERRRKRAADGQEHSDILERSQLIAQLHDPTSVYHRFHKLLRQCKVDDGTGPNSHGLHLKLIDKLRTACFASAATENGTRTTLEFMY
ncbi:unnamed protein product [Heterobilharzia americana]|nr:unnamed protein product [Heterobilharzia americana]